MNIHPTAIIEPGAQLGPDCTVGPYAIVGAHCVLGARNTIQAHAILTGNVIMGEDNLVGYGTVIGSPPQDFNYDESKMTSDVRIGNHNTFREYVTIHRGATDQSSTIIGNHNFLMTACHVAHNVRIQNHIVIANNCLLAGYVDVEDRCVLGGGTVFHQFIRLGKYCMARGGTRFSQDIPPFTMGDEDNVLAGLNIIGLRRNHFSTETRAEIKQAFKLVYRSGLNISQALEAANKQSWGEEAQAFFQFIRDSKRGVCRAHHIGHSTTE